MSWFSACFSRQNSSPSEQSQNVHINEEIYNVANKIGEHAKLYTYKELQTATENFSLANKIGQGGFGSVFKGKLNDGTLAAIKVLSAQSEQGVQEFLNEIVAISGLVHENLVQLCGCCTERHHRILVYGYLENNSLARSLIGGHNNLEFSWKVRRDICIGVARGLAFLHEEVSPHIVHRDIKASNVLLDKDFTPKISDFGLAKLFPTTITHVSTRVAGTLGYMAPEYAIRGKLTRKADVYSFGVLLLEIVTGNSNTNKRLPAADQNLLERAWRLHEKGKLIELVDEALDVDPTTEEACKYLKVGLLCTQDMPNKRPIMSTVVKMLEGEVAVNDKKISKPGLLADLMALRTSNNDDAHASSSGSQETTDVTHGTMSFSSVYERGN